LDVNIQFKEFSVMISQTVEYALRAVAHLTQEAPAHRTTDQIAVATKVPKAYLSKVLQGLVRAHIVLSQRGAGGGITLARPAEELTILDVVNAVDPLQRIHTCPLGLSGHGVNLCPMHRQLDDALAAVEKVFASTSLADLLNQPGSKPLCDVATKVRGLRIKP
jgi:Rrf2 family protein